jgi:hypothetical protein
MAFNAPPNATLAFNISRLPEHPEIGKKVYVDKEDVS